MIKLLVPVILAVSVIITGCRAAPPKASPCIGLIVQDKAQQVQETSEKQAEAGVAPEDDVLQSREPESAQGAPGAAGDAGPAEGGLSRTDQLSLLVVSRELNAIRKDIFLALNHVSSMDISNFSQDNRELVDEIEDALAETRHYLDHEAELIYAMPYIKDAYFHDLLKNRLEGITRTREIIHLYKANLESIFKKLGTSADVFSPATVLKHFESALKQLDEGYRILMPYGKGISSQ